MSGIDKEVNQLIEAILASEEYGGYMAEMEKVKQEPGLKERIDEFRRRNYELQTRGEYGFDVMEQLEREYGALLQQPQVSAFLDAELAFCRMIQDIDVRISEAIKFE